MFASSVDISKVKYFRVGESCLNRLLINSIIPILEENIIKRVAQKLWSCWINLLRLIHFEYMKNSFQEPLSKNTDAIFVISSMIERSSIKYGNLAYKVAILEAGHIGQNVYLVSDALGLKCCAHGDFNKDLIHKLLDIDGITETAFYALSVSN